MSNTFLLVDVRFSNAYTGEQQPLLSHLPSRSPGIPFPGSRANLSPGDFPGSHRATSGAFNAEESVPPAVYTSARCLRQVTKTQKLLPIVLSTVSTSLKLLLGLMDFSNFTLA